MLAPEFDAADAERQLRTRPDLEVGVGLLRQSLISGMGNVFKSEVCFASRVNPFRLVGTLTADELQLLMSERSQVHAQNVTETSDDTS